MDPAYASTTDSAHQAQVEGFIAVPRMERQWSLKLAVVWLALTAQHGSGFTTPGKGPTSKIIELEFTF